MDAMDMFSQKLPISAFCCRDPQSDKASCQRLCHRYLSNNWMSHGPIIYMFIGNLMSAVWNADLTPKVTFTNACTCYYMLLLHLSEGKRVRGEHWKERTLPGPTLRNCLHLMSHAMLSCMFTCADLPWKLSSRCERFAETHFSSVKASWRGTPSVRDAIFGNHLHNLRSMAEAKKYRWPDVKPGQAVDSFTAGELSQQCLQAACSFQSAISKARTAANIKQDLLHWYKVEGVAFLTINRRADGWQEDMQCSLELTYCHVTTQNHPTTSGRPGC